MSLRSTLQFLLEHPLTKDRPLRALWRFGSWQLRSRLFPRPTVIPWIGNTQLWINRGWTGVTGNYYVGLHEFEDMAFLLHLLRPGDVFADVGANMGTYTLLASGVCGAYTYSFEPVPATYQRLVANIELNQLQTRCQPHQMAAGAQKGEISFTQGQDTTNHVAVAGESDVITVPVCALDEQLDKTPLLIKIDVEGFETEVIKGAQGLLRDAGLKAIIIELNGSGGRYGYDEVAIHQQLLNLGFMACTYTPFHRHLQVVADFGSHNTIYCRDIVWVKHRLQEAKQVQVLHHRF